MKRRLSALTRAAFYLLVLGASALFGQQTATLTGTVTDSTAAVIPGVQVTITNVDTGEQYTTSTTEVGKPANLATCTLDLYSNGAVTPTNSFTYPAGALAAGESFVVCNAGAGAALKLAMNQLIASLTAGFSLSLGYARKNGVDTDVFMDTVRESALYARTYDKKLEKYLSRDFGKANFSTRHLLKDVRLFIEDAKEAGLNTAALEGIEQITSQTVEDGYAVMDYSSIYQTIVPED